MRFFDLRLASQRKPCTLEHSCCSLGSQLSESSSRIPILFLLSEPVDLCLYKISSGFFMHEIWKVNRIIEYNSRVQCYLQKTENTEASDRDLDQKNFAVLEDDSRAQHKEQQIKEKIVYWKNNSNMASARLRCQLFLFTVLLMAAVTSGAKLSRSYYSRTCPKLESVVRNKVNQLINADRGMAPGLLRLHFHDCFVRVSYFSSEPWYSVQPYSTLNVFGLMNARLSWLFLLLVL